MNAKQRRKEMRKMLLSPFRGDTCIFCGCAVKFGDEHARDNRDGTVSCFTFGEFRPTPSLSAVMRL